MIRAATARAAAGAFAWAGLVAGLLGSGCVGAIGPTPGESAAGAFGPTGNGGPGSPGNQGPGSSPGSSNGGSTNGGPVNPAPSTPPPAWTEPGSSAPMPSACSTQASGLVAPSTMRRLSAEEYRRSVRDLLGMAADAALPLTMPDESRIDGFDNNGSAQILTDKHVQGLTESVEGLTTALLADAARRNSVFGCAPTGANRPDLHPRLHHPSGPPGVPPAADHGRDRPLRRAGRRRPTATPSPTPGWSWCCRRC